MPVTHTHPLIHSLLCNLFVLSLVTFDLLLLFLYRITVTPAPLNTTEPAEHFLPQTDLTSLPFQMKLYDKTLICHPIKPDT